jgi:hypothetical protein
MASIESPCIHKMPMHTGESALLLDNALECPGSLDVPPVDPFEKHRQLSWRERNGAALRLRPHEATLLQTLGEEAKTITIEPEALDDVTSSAAKNKDMTREGLQLEHSLYLGTEPMKSTAHIGHACCDPYPGPRWKLNHFFTLARTQRTSSGSAPRSTLIRTLPASSMQIEPPADTCS